MNNNSMTSSNQLYENSNHKFGIMNSNRWRPHMKNSILNLDNYGNGTHWVSIKKEDDHHYL